MNLDTPGANYYPSTIRNCLLITMLITYWSLQLTFATFLSAATHLCGNPLLPGLEFCQTGSSESASLPLRFKEGVGFAIKIEELETLAAENVDLPLLLTLEQGDIRGLILEVIVDPSIKQVLY
jgi:hypothetical protein